MAAQAAPRHTAPTPGGLCPCPPYSGQVRKRSCLPPSCKIRTVVLWCRHDAKVSSGSGPPARSSSLEPAAYVCIGGVQRDSPSGSVWGMFPQAHNPPRKGGTRANAVSRQALWSHTAPPRFITVSLRLHYGSSQLSYGLLTPCYAFCYGSVPENPEIRLIRVTNIQSKGAPLSGESPVPLQRPPR